MSSAEQHPEVLDILVGDDGTGTIDAAQLARLGVKPGTHLSAVPVEAPRGVDRQPGVETPHREELSFIGSIKGGPRDLARNTDKYLAGFGE